ncbi:16S rRNA (guanine(527)-N(7))-methyltransferase RsmG [Chelativorans sp. Marseille-P2723]|uniref:16S rRNA (guanine(527)-N(7))-methyltransferase RsmG n=1 Tax=Chelativorans sp. Marseille-P2723 TaxID=2709133 RepID=UPI00156F4474|nr:16S rRNA (guanine(527)-N(7))-methyltransferase RsmG [Chelativorans sp. Marseille-P2723]
MSADRFSALQSVSGPVSRETYVKLEAFAESFSRWNKRINLVASSTIPDLWERHILDSAQLLAHARDALRWLDLGSGGGFPGAIMAILLQDRPGAHVDLVESNRKKAAFLQTALAAAGAPALVHARRIEDCHGLIPAPEIITARALAPLNRLLPLIEPWIARDTRALLHKGRDYQREIEECRVAWLFDLVEHPSKAGGDGVILDITNLRRL